MKTMHKFAPSRGTNLNTHTPPPAFLFFLFLRVPSLILELMFELLFVYFLKQEDFLNRVLLHMAEPGAAKH